MDFITKLAKAREENNSLLCVGLDTDMDKLPEHILETEDPIFEFNKLIIDATKDITSCYKPNIAFYEAEGIKGMQSLEKTIDYIPKNIPVLLDAKRGDIGNTCDKYAKACFEHLKVDALTLSPYMGWDSISPFAKYEGKGLFILVKTSNDSSPDFQDITNKNDKPLFLEVAEKISHWQKESKATLGAVVGATYPKDLKIVRETLGNLPILLPGLGAQGGSAQETVQFGCGSDGKAPILVNSSRGILYASKDKNFAEASRAKAQEVKDQLNSYL